MPLQNTYVKKEFHLIRCIFVSRCSYMYFAPCWVFLYLSKRDYLKNVFLEIFWNNWCSQKVMQPVSTHLQLFPKTVVIANKKLTGRGSTRCVLSVYVTCQLDCGAPTLVETWDFLRLAWSCNWTQFTIHVQSQHYWH